MTDIIEICCVSVHVTCNPHPTLRDSGAGLLCPATALIKYSVVLELTPHQTHQRTTGLGPGFCWGCLFHGVLLATDISRSGDALYQFVGWLIAALTAALVLRSSGHE